MKAGVLIFISLMAVIGIFYQDPIAQDPVYHQFADQRSLGGIPHTLNVLSSVPYLLFGIFGIYSLAAKRNLSLVSRLRGVYQLLFVAVTLVGVGSMYYHLEPGNTTLF